MYERREEEHRREPSPADELAEQLFLQREWNEVEAMGERIAAEQTRRELPIHERHPNLFRRARNAAGVAVAAAGLFLAVNHFRVTDQDVALDLLEGQTEADCDGEIRTAFGRPSEAEFPHAEAQSAVWNTVVGDVRFRDAERIGSRAYMLDLLENDGRVGLCLVGAPNDGRPEALSFALDPTDVQHLQEFAGVEG